jgi:RNA polymerase sigma-70 factor (ECF subfamily)
MTDVMGTARQEPTGLWDEHERTRLVRLCALLSGDRNAAEDLAQETLLEAWRNAHKLRDPSGADRWLAAIARNVCRRWARRRGREGAVLNMLEAAPPPERDDLELELERAELLELLDRALALLPGETRDVLVRRYVDESSHAEIGELLGLSADAVSMRLTRGKVVLRRVLGSELRDEADAHGLHGLPEDAWRETRVWCARCGRARLLVRRQPSPGATAFRCPACCPDESALASEFRLGNPFFARLLDGLTRPSAVLARAAAWSSRYFAGGRGDPVECTRCGRETPLVKYSREDAAPDESRARGLAAVCAGCGEEVSSSLGGLALVRPEVRRFRRDHPRLHEVPIRQVESCGRAALVVRFQSLSGSAGVDVVFSRDTLRVLHAG